jgi:hypothetical protein
MSNGWSPERRAKQALLIKTWRPWERSTGPRTADGKAVSARNAYRGGQWRSMRELRRLLIGLLRQHRTGLQQMNAAIAEDTGWPQDNQEMNAQG